MAIAEVLKFLGAAGVEWVSVLPLPGNGQVQRILLPPNPGLQLIFVNCASHSSVLERALCCGDSPAGTHESLSLYIPEQFITRRYSCPAGDPVLSACCACSLCACCMSGTVFKHHRLLEMLQLRGCWVRAALVLVTGTRRT